MSRSPHERAIEIANEEWLNLGDTTKLEIVNPFAMRTEEDIEKPIDHLLALMRRPEYFGFTCKWLFNKTLVPYQGAWLYELWNRPFPMLVGSRGAGKSFMLGLYCVLRALFTQGTKIVIVGAAFRQAKYVFEYAENIWHNAPMLQDICGDSRRNGPKRDVDRCVFRIGESEIVALPIGDGSKIRGQRASIIISDEFSSVPLPIYETVIEPFASVSMDPVAKLQEAARIRAFKRMGLWSDEQEAETGIGFLSNQSIISGSAYYGFNHFAAYWRRWKAIIESRGEPKKLQEIFGGDVPPKFNWRDYCVIRMPVELLPEGFMDEKNVAKARATVHLTQYQMEYGACFANDSNGFFKASLIQSCVVGNPVTPIEHRSCGEVCFNAVLKGLPTRRYVMGIDPASEHDNFSIVVLELWGDHRRIVYCWTTTRKRHKAKLKKGLTQEHDFYSYAARKIRELMYLFPCERLCVDSQGGGVSIIEALQDPKRLAAGERPIYPVIDFDDPKDTDALVGDHILEVVNFAKSEWVVQANHGMKKDFEDKVLLFPQFDTAVLGLAIEEDKERGRVIADDEWTEKLYDTLEDAIMEIEDLKDELATIVHTQTGTTMRDRWDTPEVKLPGGKKGRLRKDRYSSLLMANMAARILALTPIQADVEVYGGFAREIVGRSKGRAARATNHQNPSWYTEKVQTGRAFGAVVQRRR